MTQATPSQVVRINGVTAIRRIFGGQLFFIKGCPFFYSGFEHLSGHVTKGFGKAIYRFSKAFCYMNADQTG